MLGFPRTRSPGIAAALIGIAALASLIPRHIPSIRSQTDRPPTVEEQFIAKYESLRGMLPAGEPIRFEIDRAHADPNVMDYGGRLFLAQYAVSPLLLTTWTSPRWMVIESDPSETAPAFPALTGWRQTADLGNGLRIYRAQREPP